MEEKVTALVALGGTVALLNYLGKVNEEESLKIILAMVCALYVPSHQNWKVLYTREITFYKSIILSVWKCHLYSGWKMAFPALFGLREAIFSTK